MSIANGTIAGPIIALDTSTAAMAAAALRGNTVIGELQSLAERNHSVHVITELKRLLEMSGIQRDELAAIVVGSGPGSYTGMRIAVTAAKTLAWAWNKPLAGVSSLEAIAYGAWHKGTGAELGASAQVNTGTEHWLLPIMDARRGQVYCAGFSCGSSADSWSRWADDGVRMMNEWVDAIYERVRSEWITCAFDHTTHEISANRKDTTDEMSASRRDRAHEQSPASHEAPALIVWLTGDLSLHMNSAARLQELVSGAGANVEVRLLPYELEGRYLAFLGSKRLGSGPPDDTHTCIPNYTQLTEAEVKLKAKQLEGGGGR